MKNANRIAFLSALIATASCALATMVAAQPAKAQPAAEKWERRIEIKPPKFVPSSPAVAFNRDNSLMAVAAQDTPGDGYLVLGTAKGDNVGFLPCSVSGPGGYSRVAFAPDSKSAFTVAPAATTQWGLEKKQKDKSWTLGKPPPGYDRSINHADLAPDGAALLVYSGLSKQSDFKVGKEESLKVHDPVTGKVKATPQFPKGVRLQTHEGIFFSWDGKKLWMGCVEGKPPAAKFTLRSWSAESGKPEDAIELPKLKDGTLAAATRGADGKTLVALVRSPTACAYHLIDPYKKKVTDTFNTGLKEWPQQLVLTPDRKLLTAFFQGQKLVVWDVTLNKEAFSAKANESNTDSVAFSPDGSLLALIRSRSIVLWERKTKSP